MGNHIRLLTAALLILRPGLSYVQIGNRTTNNDDLVSSSRLGKLAKKIEYEKPSTTNPQSNP